MIKQRDYKIDIVRIVACLMVILMHSPMPNMELSGIIAVGNTMITLPCIGFFFIVSGYLLLPVKTSMKDFSHMISRFSIGNFIIGYNRKK